MEQQTGSKSGKEYVKVVYCHPVYLTYTQSTSWETLDEAQAGKSRLWGEIINNLRGRWYHTQGRKQRTKEPLDENERGEWKSWLKTQHSENSSLITLWQINGETAETAADFIFLGSKITSDGDCSYEIKRPLLLGRKVITNLDSLLNSRDITLQQKPV